jgi:hypothetical protein
MNNPELLQTPIQGKATFSLSSIKIVMRKLMNADYF